MTGRRRSSQRSVSWPPRAGRAVLGGGPVPAHEAPVAGDRCSRDASPKKPMPRRRWQVGERDAAGPGARLEHSSSTGRGSAVWSSAFSAHGHLEAAGAEALDVLLPQQATPAGRRARSSSPAGSPRTDPAEGIDRHHLDALARDCLPDVRAARTRRRGSAPPAASISCSAPRGSTSPSDGRLGTRRGGEAGPRLPAAGARPPIARSRLVGSAAAASGAGGKAAVAERLQPAHRPHPELGQRRARRHEPPQGQAAA